MTILRNTPRPWPKDQSGGVGPELTVSGLVCLLVLGCVTAEGGVVVARAGSEAGTVSPCAAEAGCAPPTADTDAADGGADAADASDAVAVEDGAADAEPDAEPDARTPDAATPDMCAPQDEVCDGLDDDCDEQVDEGFDLASDPAHCGACDRSCARPHAEVACAQSECILVGCDAGWLNGDLDPANGCERPDVTLRLLSPADGQYLAGRLPLEFELDGAEHVDRVEGRLGEMPLGRLDSPAALDVARHPEGNAALALEALDADDAVLASATVAVVLDRTPPVVGFAAPAADSLLRATFEVRLTVDDAGPVAVALRVDQAPAGEVEAPFVVELDPTGFTPGPRTLHATATDAAGNAGAAQVDVRFSFCPADVTVALGGADIEVDAYEASRPDATADDAGLDGARACSAPGVLPWGGADHPTAAAACASAGKRLCTVNEWRRACGGARRSAYPYGAVFQAAACNGIGHPDAALLEPTGALPDCVTDEGAFDLSGNLAEWTADLADPAVSGGHGGSDSGGLRCTARTPFALGFIQPENGFRCCRDP